MQYKYHIRTLCNILLAALKITKRHSISRGFQNSSHTLTRFGEAGVRRILEPACISPQSMISFLLAKIYNYYMISSDLVRDILSSSIRGLKLLKSCN